MPTITIDGQPFEYDSEKDQKLLKFALDNGVDIPYFCYHPSMSVPTNCRMCLVEVGFPMKDRQTGEPILDENGEQKIGWGRKPATSCSQDLAPDMIVRTQNTSDTIQKAQEGVLEFMLINHPLDCPICDQAGECPLQIQTYKFGPEGSRFEHGKVHKPKRVQLGPNVVLDAERCINCTRCTRFAAEISGSHQLTIVERGERNFPATPPGITFDDPYSMNTIDLCPVGALTSDDFRFKARAWEMNYAPGIDTSDAMGTNIDVWVRDNEVLRLTPRHNPEVNDYWMTDEGRLGYPKYNDRRVSGVKLKGDVPVDWETGYDHAAQLLEAHRGSTLFLGSAHASLESNYALRELAKAYGAGDAFFVPHFIPGRADHLLKTDDVTPNRAGCLLTGLTEIEEDTLLRKLADDGITLVYSLEDEAVAQRLMRDFSGESILHAHHYFDGFDQATVLFGAAMEIEQPGTFVNIHGLPQQTIQARQIKQMTPEDWMAMAKSRLDAGGQLTDRWRHSDHILDVLAGWRISGELIQRAGGAFDFNGYQTLQKHLKGEFSVLEQLRKPPRKQRKESFKMSQFEFAIDLRGKTF